MCGSGKSRGWGWNVMWFCVCVYVWLCLIGGRASKAVAYLYMCKKIPGAFFLSRVWPTSPQFASPKVHSLLLETWAHNPLCNSVWAFTCILYVVNWTDMEFTRSSEQWIKKKTSISWVCWMMGWRKSGFGTGIPSHELMTRWDWYFQLLIGVAAP